jgi:hypothetical protein
MTPKPIVTKQKDLSTESPKGARSETGEQFVFAYGNLYHGLPYGPRNAILPGFERWHKGYASCRETSDPDELLYGRVVAVSDETLARMDTAAERLGDFHRFLADVTLGNGKILKGVWVYQMTEHGSPATFKVSANGGFREAHL